LSSSRRQYVWSSGASGFLRQPRSLGIVEQTLSNWVKAHRAGKLRGAGNRAELTAEQVEWLQGQHFATIREAKDAVLEWLPRYNRNRMHSTLGYSSPAEYEQRRLAQQVKAAPEESNDRSRRRKYGDRKNRFPHSRRHDDCDEMR
jgi:putative transposase